MPLEPGRLRLSFSIMVIDNFRFECLLGSDFMTKYDLHIQYGTKTVVLSDEKWIPFFQLTRKRPSFLCTDVLGTL